MHCGRNNDVGRQVSNRGSPRLAHELVHNDTDVNEYV